MDKRGEQGHIKRTGEIGALFRYSGVLCSRAYGEIALLLCQLRLFQMVATPTSERTNQIVLH
jgi:hypothetical protein